MRHKDKALARADAYAVAVFPMEAAALQGWFEQRGPRLRLAGDPDRKVAAQYGVSPLSWRRLITVDTIRHGLAAARGAKLPPRPGGDVLGRPALFVIDRTRRVAFAHVAKDMADRPGWEPVFAALNRDPSKCPP